MTDSELREKVRKGLRGSKSITWDGCHKIYIASDQQGHQFLLDVGYKALPVDDVNVALNTICKWWGKACPLRFVQSIRSGKFVNVIPQGE